MTDTARRKLIRQLMEFELTAEEAEEIVDNRWGEIEKLMADAFAAIVRLIVVDIAKAITKRIGK